jgi:hypothetical protein
MTNWQALHSICHIALSRYSNMVNRCEPNPSEQDLILANSLGNKLNRVESLSVLKRFNPESYPV